MKPELGSMKNIYSFKFTLLKDIEQLVSGACTTLSLPFLKDIEQRINIPYTRPKKTERTKKKKSFKTSELVVKMEQKTQEIREKNLRRKEDANFDLI